VNVKTNFAATVHLVSFSIKLGQFQVHWGTWVGCRYLKLKVELVANKVVHEPALSSPLGSLSVRFNGEPITVCLLVHLYVFNKNHVFFFQPFNPLVAIEGACDCLN
jgi:hypothetical protein